ncbi:uncharacterized protein LOC133326061 [Musca vetustissima]|uniref:uncharacterized protein LOC133326061 n=1 Tax=Musca vetustissima TaxID=27455 RepID=UPI002AB762BE|nr:uncharacterized protein LOC133326061 [Musca vetustissima]
MLKSFKIYTCTNGSLGLHLSRAPWDPYPWVSSIQKDSNSYKAGLRIGDCLLELNGNDVLGLKISEIAALLKNHWLNESSNYVSVVIWRKKAKDNSDTEGEGEDDDEDEENNAHNINQQSLQKFATCLQHIAQLLECPVCLEVVKPPGWQCCNGHVLCNNCRSRSEKCPVCRVPLGPRGRCLLSDKLFTLLADSFPCDGVRNSNKNSPKDRRKCTTEFHNQPKLAIESKQQQCQDEVKAKKDLDIKKTEHDSILSSLRMGRRRRTKTKKEETENNANEQEEEGQQENKRPHHSMALQQQQQGATNAVVNVSVNTDDANNINRKSSQDYRDGVATAATRTAGVTSMTVQVPVRFIVENNITTFGSSSNELAVQDAIPTAAATVAEKCHCRECYKPDKVAIVNNVPTTTTTTTTLNKYILRVYEEALLHHQHKPRQYYQCPTGKLCCLQQNVMPQADASEVVASTRQQQLQMTNGNLLTEQTTVAAADNTSNTSITTKILHNEWQLLTHLTQDHQLAVNQYYAEFGQRINVRPDARQQSIICLNLRSNESTSHTTTTTAQMEKFFVAFVPMSDNAANVLATSSHANHKSSLENSNSLNVTTTAATTTTTTSKVAIFIWHMNPLQLQGNDHVSRGQESYSNQFSNAGDDDEVSNFDAIIENPKTGIKWFGPAHCLTTPWSHIYRKQHFFMHETVIEEGPNGNGCGSGDSFVIVIKRKS